MPYSDYAADVIADAITGNGTAQAVIAAWTNNLWIGALTAYPTPNLTGTTVSEANYTPYNNGSGRQNVTGWNVAAGRIKTNSGTISFPKCTSGSSTITAWGVFDSPVLPAPTWAATVFSGASATGGHLAASTEYFYVITATDAAGQTVVSTEQNYTTPSGTATNQITLNWVQVPNASGYKVYRSTTTGTELLLATIGSGSTVSYTDSSNTTPSGAQPSSNTTGGNLLWYTLYLNPQTISGGNLTSSGGVATAILTAHGFSNNQNILHTGAEQPEYNVWADVTVIDANTYTFPIVNSPASPATAASGQTLQAWSKTQLATTVNIAPSFAAGNFLMQF